MSFFVFRIYRMSVQSDGDSKFYDYRILVCGPDRHKEFMADFYSGVKFISSTYDSITEYIDIDSTYEDFSMDKYLDLAKFSDADGK